MTACRSLNIHLELGRFYKVFATWTKNRPASNTTPSSRPCATATRPPRFGEEHLHATEDRIFRLIDKYPESLTGYNGTKSGR